MIRNVDVDASVRVAHASGGATWLDFDTVTQALNSSPLAESWPRLLSAGSPSVVESAISQPSTD
jgi:hypothetical protein